MTFRDLLGQNRLVAAHRGFRACYPENTLCAFTASLGHCHFIELDVQLNNDGVPVVIHDETLARTSDAREKAPQLGHSSLRVDTWTLDDLRQLDMGSWFMISDPFQTLARGEITRELLLPKMPQQIMTLTELLQWAIQQDICINVEIKDHSSSALNTIAASAVMAVINATDTADLVLISSFNHDYLRQCKALDSRIPVGVLQDDSHPPELLRYLDELQADAYHPSDALTDEALIRTLRTAGLAINVYTVNDRCRKQQLFDQNVTAIFTDYPAIP